MVLFFSYNQEPLFLTQKKRLIQVPIGQFFSEPYYPYFTSSTKKNHGFRGNLEATNEYTPDFFHIGT